MTATTHTTRTDAIDSEIVVPIEASGVVEDATIEFDIDAIAAEVLGDYGQGFVRIVTADEFWAIVERNAR